MENWININQSRSYEWGLNGVQEKLCAYYSREHSWVTNRIRQEDGDYISIAISKLIYELPTLGRVKSTFSRALNSLADKGVFDKKISAYNKREVFYRFNPVFLEAWRDNNKAIASCLETKEILLIQNKSCTDATDVLTKSNTLYKQQDINNKTSLKQELKRDNGTSVAKMQQLKQEDYNSNTSSLDSSIKPETRAIEQLQNVVKIQGEAIQKILSLLTSGTSVAQGQQMYQENSQGVAKLDGSVAPVAQSVAVLHRSVAQAQEQTISINNQINNNKHDQHKHDEVDVDVEDLENIRRKKDLSEFEKILEIYPDTVNNTKEKKIEAFAVFRTLNSAQRFNLHQAVLNYSKTKEVRNAQTSKYIQSIYTFLTKSYTKFIHEIPQNYELAEEFQENSNMGVNIVHKVEEKEYDAGMGWLYGEAGRKKIGEYTLKLEELKSLILKGVSEEEFESRAKELFTPLEFEQVIVEMGAYFRLKDFKAEQFATGLFDSLYPIYDKNDDLIVYDENFYLQAS